MARWNVSQLVRRAVPAVALFAASCGGQSESDSGDSNGGKGGTGGTGGDSATGGVAGTGAAMTGGTSGSVATGGTSGAAGCEYGGRIYADGDGFPSGDGCNSCFCSNGGVGCTDRACPPPEECAALSEAYADALVRAKRCDPAAEFTCDASVGSALQCGCPTHVGDPTAIDELVALSAEWQGQSCGGGVTCGACPPEPIGGYCSADGVCVDVFPE